jgi:hypothetical protein
MAYSSTKSRISGKIAAGGFKQPDNTLAKAIDTGAGLMAKGIMKRGEEEREEKRVAKREAAAEARRLAAAQSKKEEEARKNQRIANSIATRFGIDPRNAQAMAYVTNEVEVYGTDAVGVIQKDFDDGKFTLPDVEVTEDFVTGASPNQAPPIRLNTNNPDGSIRTTLGYGDDIDDLEKTDPTQAERQRLGLNLDPQQFNRGEVQTASTTNQGFAFDPLAKKSDIDWVSVTDPADVANLRRLHDAGRQVLSEVDLNVLALYEKDFEAAKTAEITATNIETSRKILLMNEDQLEGVLQATEEVYDKNMKDMAQNLLKKKQDAIKKSEDKDATAKALEFSRSLVSMDAEGLRRIQASSSYTQEEKTEAAAQLAALPGEPFDLTDYDDVKDSTLQTIIAAKGTDPKKVTALQALLSNRANTAPKVDTKSQDYLITYLDEAGEQQSTVAKMAADGSGFVDLTSLKPVVPAEGTQPLNMELQSDLYDNIVKINTSLIKPLKEQRVAMVTTLASAKKLDDLARDNPEILTTLGGKIPKVLKRVGLETKALVDLFNSNGSVEGTLSTLDQRFNQYINDSSLSGTARAAALFQAEKIKMAFMFAASSLGQSGKGLSNEDFQRALDILDQGSDYKTFSMNMRSQMQSVILMTETQITDFIEDGSAIALNNLDTSGELLAGYKQNAETYATNRGLGDAFTWAKSEVDTPAPNANPPNANPPTLEEFIQKAREMNVGKSDADLEAYWIKEYGGSN